MGCDLPLPSTIYCFTLFFKHLQYDSLKKKKKDAVFLANLNNASIFARALTH
jgi:hypothetical protein